MARFISERDRKKIIIANVGIEDKTNYIKGTYIEESTFPDLRISVKLDNKDSVITGNLVYEDFKLIIQDDHSDITVRAQDPYFSWFINFKGEETSYDEYLASYVELSKKYPDSRFLMSNFSGNLNLYKSKKNVKLIYQNLSNKLKYMTKIVSH